MHQVVLARIQVWYRYVRIATTLIPSQGTVYSVDLRQTVCTTDGLQRYGDNNDVRHVAQVFPHGLLPCT